MVLATLTEMIGIGAVFPFLTILVDPNLIKLADVPYGKNLFVMFINSKKSIHGVSPRSKTKRSRRLINIIGEMYSHPNGGMW